MSKLPTGTVTFLFTDIEGSTRLWESDPEAMRLAITQHEQIVRGAIESTDGEVFKTLGDGFRAAFSSPANAVRAAARAQQELGSAAWPTEKPIRVRMAVHCGSVECSHDDYCGPTLNRCARIEDLAHGGQVLVSQAAFVLVRDELSEGLSLRCLGDHPLRDLTRPERVFQLEHPDLATEFPPLRSLEQLPNNLPVRLTRFIGRTEEVAEVTSLLRKSRLVTLVGAGGTGKTRLALQVAADLMVHWRDGAWLVDLAPVAESAQVFPAVAAAMGIGEEPGRSVAETTAEALRRRHLLLILDNCEHLILECARAADKVLTSAADITLLATSREALGIAGEVCYRVTGLSVPPPGDSVVASPAEPPVTADLTRYEAVRLFVERAQEAEPGFTLDGSNAQAVAEISRRLDGIPLALELAAARLPFLSAPQIADRLDRRFQLLTGGSRVALPRQQTLRAAVDWSYDLLDSREKAVLARLSVFASGCTPEAADYVCAGANVPTESVIDVVLQLASKSMVNVSRGPRGARYTLTQTMRDYAREKLLQCDETEPARDRHLEYFLAEIERMEGLPDGPDLPQQLERLDEEHGNIGAALRWAAIRGDINSGLRIAVGMARYWEIRGHWSEGRSHLERYPVDSGEAVPQTVLADALTARARLARYQGDFESAQTDFTEALAIGRSLGDRGRTAAALNGLGNLAFTSGSLEQAAAHFSESLELARASGDELYAAGLLGNLGNVALRLRDLDAAQARHEESLAIRRRLGDRRGSASALVNIGNVAYHRGQWSEARDRHEESLVIRREIGDKSGTATSLLNLCAALVELGELDAARDCAVESLELNRSLHDPVGIAFALSNLAEVDLVENDIDAAAASFSESLRVGTDIDDPRIVAPALTGLAKIAMRRGDPRLAVRLLGVADRHGEEKGAAASRRTQERAARIQAACAAALSAEDTEAEREASREMVLGEVVAIASQMAEQGHPGQGSEEGRAEAEPET